jgi:hypothetical protein
MKKKQPVDNPTYATVIRALADRDLLYATTDRGLADTFNAAVSAGLEPADMVREVSTWTLEGQRSGHEWYICSGCDQVRLMHPQSRRRCPHGMLSLPPRCRGRMIRVARRPRLTRRLHDVLVGPR